MSQYCSPFMLTTIFSHNIAHVDTLVLTGGFHGESRENGKEKTHVASGKHHHFELVHCDGSERWKTSEDTPKLHTIQMFLLFLLKVGVMHSHASLGCSKQELKPFEWKETFLPQ